MEEVHKNQRFLGSQKSKIFEKTSFNLVFGNAPIIKVLDFFIDNREFDYSLTDIAKNSDIGWSTLHQFWDKLVSLEIVIKTRDIGRAQLYKLNMNSPLVKKLLDLDKAISKKLMKEELENYNVKVTV